MRIAYVTHYPELYGANRSLLDLMLELRRRGEVEPHVLLPREGPLSDRLAAEGIAFAVIPWQPWMSERHYMGRMHHRVKQYLHYERAARERRVHNQQLMPTVLSTLRSWNVDAIHVNSAAVGIVPGLQQAHLVPFIWHIRELPEAQYLLHIDQGRRAYGRCLRAADRLIAISQAVRTDILRYAGNGVRPSVIYNGVLTLDDHRALAARSEERWRSPTPFTFLLAGLIHPSKGQEEAIQAMALLRDRHPDVRLVIAGDGKAGHLVKLITELGLGQHVTLAGFVKDLRPLFLSGHALLMCSRNEAMGRVTVEAMGSGMPVIGHASGGTPELIEHGLTGLLYPGGASALAERMAALVADRTLARELGIKGMHSAAERFNVERYAAEVLEVYRSVLSRGQR
jgi:glycosyltransferase involved in cell wall biosynthesis